MSDADYQRRIVSRDELMRAEGKSVEHLGAGFYRITPPRPREDRLAELYDKHRPPFRHFAARSVLLALGLWVLVWILLKIADFLPFI